MTALLLALMNPASATELTWEGYYRARGLLYNSLSMSESNELSEGTSNYFDHRLLLRPSWLLSPQAAIRADLDVLKLVQWGQAADTWTDPVTGEQISSAQADGVAVANPGIYAVRAWGEGRFDVGSAQMRVAAGRMPLHWGSGILWNDGNAVDGEYGDTADRLQATALIGPVYVMGAWDVQSEGFVGVADDMQSASLAFAYQSESAGVGFLSNYRYQPSLDYQAYTGDIWGRADLGPVFAEVEMVGVFGAGDLDTGANGIQISSLGVMARGGFDGEKLGAGVELGVASGDADETDTKLKSFTFDRDHNISLILFEETMPTLESSVVNDSNGGRTTEAARTGDGISNAIYFTPMVKYRFNDMFQARASWLIAAQAKGPEDGVGNGYGNEFDLGLRVDPVPHIWGDLGVGFLLPGGYFSDYNDADLGGGFNRPVVAIRFLGTVEF